MVSAADPLGRNLGFLDQFYISIIFICIYIEKKYGFCDKRSVFVGTEAVMAYQMISSVSK
jgi:hypothetical protein